MNEFRNIPVLPVPWAGAGPAKYANSAIVVFTPWDFSFEFSHMTPTVTPGGPTGQEPQLQVGKVIQDWITMSPHHAKAFLKALTENVAQYEEQFGEIPLIQQPQQPIGGQE